MPPLRPRILRHLIAAASGHLVLTCLESDTSSPDSCWPPEFAAFLAAIRQSNIARNRALQTQAAGIGRLLQSAGITTVVLKGAAELFSPSFPAEGMRFLTDLDILVPAEAVAEAQTIMLANGYRSPVADTTVTPDHHQPVLVLEGGSEPGAPDVFVDLHHRMMVPAADALLTSQDCLARAEAVAGEAIRCPDPVTRMIHLVAHAQIADDHYRARRTRLREIAEFAVLNATLDPAARAEVADRFEAHGFGMQFLGFAAAADRLLGPLPGLSRQGRDTPAGKWAAAAHRNLSSPGRMRLAYMARWLGSVARGLATSPDARRRARRILTERAVRRASLAARRRHLRDLR